MKDLNMACKLDYDDDANEWLKEVKPKVQDFFKQFGNTKYLCSILGLGCMYRGKQFNNVRGFIYLLFPARGLEGNWFFTKTF